MSNAAAMWDAILKSGLFPLTTLKECTKPNRKAASTDPMVVLNAKTIFEDGTYRGVKLIAVKAPSLRSKLTRKAKAKEGTASASGDVPVLTDHVLALQGAIGDIRDFATCFKQHFFERMLGKEDLAPSATDDMDEEGAA